MFQVGGGMAGVYGIPTGNIWESTEVETVQENPPSPTRNLLNHTNLQSAPSEPIKNPSFFLRKQEFPSPKWLPISSRKIEIRKDVAFQTAPPPEV